MQHKGTETKVYHSWRLERYFRDLPHCLQNRVYTYQYSQVADLSFTEGIVDQIISRDKLTISLEDNSIVHIKLASLSSNNESYSWEARQALYQMLVDRKVYIICVREVRPQQLLADVCLPNGESATEMLVKYGLASVQHSRYVPKKVFKHLKNVQFKAETMKRGIWGLEQKMPSAEKIYIKNLLFKQIECVVSHVQSINNIHVVTLPDNFQIEVTIPGSQNVINTKMLKMIAKKYLLNKHIEMYLHSYDISTNRFRGRITEPHLAQLFAILWRNRKRKTKHHMYNSEDIGRTSKSQQKKHRKQFWKKRKSNTKHLQKPRNTIQPLLKYVNDNFWQKNRKVCKLQHKNNGIYATVVEVLNGNSFTLKVRNQTINNVFLSYIKFPWECSSMRNLCCERIQNLKLVSMYYTHRSRLDTREVLRKLLVGNTVWICVDYLETSSRRIYCTMKVLGINIGIMLVEEGLAYYVDQETSHHTLRKNFLAAGRSNRQYYVQSSSFHVNVACSMNNVLQLSQILETEDDITVVVEQVLSPSYIILFSPNLGWLFAFSLIDFEEARQAHTGFSKKSWKDSVTKLITDMCLQHEVVLRVTAVDRNGVLHGDLTMQSWNLKELLLKKISRRNYFINTSVLLEIRPYSLIRKRKIKIPVEEIYGHNLRPKSALMELRRKRRRIKRHLRYITSLHPVVMANKPVSSQDAAVLRRLKQNLRRNVKTMTSEALSSLENSPHCIISNKKVKQRGKGNQRRQRQSRMWSMQRKRNKSERRNRRHKE